MNPELDSLVIALQRDLGEVEASFARLRNEGKCLVAHWREDRFRLHYETQTELHYFVYAAGYPAGQRDCADRLALVLDKAK